MIAFGLDSTGDFNMVKDDNEIAQKLSLLLNINVAELPWNEDIGLDHNELIANADDQEIIQSILSDYLLDQWPDIFDAIEITNFEVNSQQRITSLEATVTLTTGETITSNVGVNDQGDDNSAANN